VKRYTEPMDYRPVLDQVDRDLGLDLDKIRRCVERLDDVQVWWRAHARSNSIANLMLHLCGNLSQWVLEGLGGRPYERRRALEFSADRTATRAELVARLSGVVDECRNVIIELTEADLAAPRTIQKYETDGLRALLHVWEHMSYHTGQIVLITKQLIGDRTEIDFYPQHRGE
jgi:uncharacterized damage-inducible protein DinB